MNYTDFFNQLKSGDIANVCLMHGEEEYVKSEAFSALIRSSVENPELNLQYFDKATDANADAIIGACELIPFMSEKRVIVCRYLPTEKDAKKLIDYFDKIAKETLLIFYITGKADGKTAIVKALKKCNSDYEFAILDESEIARWVAKNAASDGLSFDLPTISFFIRLVGKSMYDVKNEYEKLRDFVITGDRIITKSIVSNIVIKNIEYQIFTTFSSFIAGKFKDGFTVLNAIMEGKDRDSESLPVAGYFLSNFKILLTAYDCSEHNMPIADIAKAINRPPFVAKEACANAKKFKRSELLSAIADFSDILTIMTSGGSGYSALVDAIVRNFMQFRKK